MNDHPRRPQWNHPDIKVAAARLIFEDFKAWAVSMEAIPENTDEQDKDLLAILALALQESPDCYEASRYIDDFWDWPVTGELTRILDRAYRALPALTPPFVVDWVMEHGIRFTPKEGDEFKFTIGDVEATATCVGAVKAEARGFAALRDGTVIPVNAEEVIKVFKTKRPGGTKRPPPTGGTPAAVPA